MPIRERNDGWIVRREIRRTGLSRAEAERLDDLLDRAHRQALLDYSLGLSGCPTILEAMENFLADPLQFPAVSDGRKRYYRRVLARFARDCSRGAGDIAVDCIARKDLDAYVAARSAERGNRGKYVPSDRISYATLANELKALQAFARWCCQRKYCSYDQDVLRLSVKRVPKRHRRHDRYPPRARHERDFAGILRRIRKARPDLALVLEGMILIGARPEAVCLCSESSVVEPGCGEDGWVEVPALKGGVETHRPVWDGSVVESWLERVRDQATAVYRRVGMRRSRRKPLIPNTRGNRWTSSAFARALHDTCRRCGVDGFTSYVARHSAITWLKRRGVPAVAIMHYAKHLQISTQDIYDWTSGEEARQAYEVIERIMSPRGARPADQGREVHREVEQVLGDLWVNGDG